MRFAHVIALTAFVALPTVAAAQAPAPIIDATQVLSGPPASEPAAETAWAADRITQARADVPADPFAAFASVMGERFTRAQAPATAAVFDRLMREASPVVTAAKTQWPRPRPPQGESSNCPGALPAGYTTPDSYPSGHAVIGWLWALTLTELAPGRADDILARGRAYGESRIVCGVHWPSDIAAGRDLAAALVARLHGDAEYRAALDAARTEVMLLLAPTPPVMVNEP